jgi:uncharacterized membrane protein
MTQLAAEAAPATRYEMEVLTPARPRLYSIDLLRGLVIVIMALDHVKGHLLNVPFDLVDLTATEPIYFITRFASHFCAPVFVFLAGTGAFLYGARGRSTKELSWFLLSRGVWLIILELTVIRFAWLLNLNYEFAFGQVIWAIGWGMIILAGFVFLPTSATVLFGLSVICCHNMFDGMRPEDFGSFSGLWCILHSPEMVRVLGRMDFFPMYSLVPWVGVLAAGYGFGHIMLLEQRRRKREVFALGLGLTLLFIVLRSYNFYGDRLSDRPGLPGAPWSLQKDWLFSVFSFVNCQKYPPSLDFLLMTLGPALMFMALCERPPGRLGRFFIVYGRVPLFFYLLHWYVIKSIQIALAYARYGDATWDFLRTGQIPPDWGYDLWVVYRSGPAWSWACFHSVAGSPA